MRSQGPARDSSHGLLIASGIFWRLVPGRPVTYYLVSLYALLKDRGAAFKARGQLVEHRRDLFGEVATCFPAGIAIAELMILVGQQKRREQQRPCLALPISCAHGFQSFVELPAEAHYMFFFPIGAGDRIIPAADGKGHIAHRSSRSIRASNWRKVEPTSLRSLS